MRNRRRTGPAVTRTPDWKDTGVVEVSFLQQNLEGEVRVGGDRETRRAIATDRHSADVLEKRLGRADLLTEFIGLELGDSVMPPAVRCDLVAGAGNSPDYMRV